MDTSPEYIKMCEKATEIQELRPKGNDWLDDDFSFFWTESMVRICDCGEDVHWLSDTAPYCEYCGKKPEPKPHNGINAPFYVFENEPDKAIWLPRQDQLQEMLDPHKPDRPLRFQDETFSMLDDLYSFVNVNDFPDSDMWSFEQWWLAFVMKEKFGKTWNGEEWQPFGITE